MLTKPFRDLSFVCFTFSLFHFGPKPDSSSEISLKSQDFRVGRDHGAFWSQKVGSFDIRVILGLPVRKLPWGDRQLTAADRVLLVIRYYHANVISSSFISTTQNNFEFDSFVKVGKVGISFAVLKRSCFTSNK